VTFALNLALCSESPAVKEQDLYRLSLVMHEYAQLVIPVWAPGGAVDIKAIDRRSRCPRGWRMLLFVDADHESSTLANHTPLSLALPTVGRVYVGLDSGLATGPHSLAESASHEVVEITANPDLARWARVPGTGGAETPVEPADASQETFELRVHGESWPVANFLYPAAFGLENPPGVEGYDHAGRLTAPFTFEAGTMPIRKSAGTSRTSRVRSIACLSRALPKAERCDRPAGKLRRASTDHPGRLAQGPEEKLGMTGRRFGLAVSLIVYPRR